MLRFVWFLLLWPAVAAAEGFVHVATIGGPGEGVGEFAAPFDVTIHGGRLYVGDSNHNRVQVFDLDGTFRFQFGGTGSADGRFRRNRGIGSTPPGVLPAVIYVTDAKNDRVQAFDPDGAHRASWGSIGQGDAEFFRPRGVAVGPDGSVVVCDADNHRIKLHAADLSLRRIVGGRGEGDGEFHAPFDVAIDADGRILVVDTFNQRVQVFDAAGDHRGQIGGPGTGVGEFVKPWSIAVGPDGSIFVGDTRDATHTLERVHHFDAAGNPLSTFGEWGTGPGQMRQPAGLAVDAAGRVYVADADNHRIMVWATVGVEVQRRSVSWVKGAFAP